MKKIIRIIKRCQSYLRIIRLKVLYGNSIVFKYDNFNVPYIGKNCTFNISPKGCVIIGSGVVLEGYNTIEAAKEAKIVIGQNTYINTYSRIIAMEQILIGDRCMLGSNVSIYDHDHDFSNGVNNASTQFKINPVRMLNEVWCGTNVTITGGCTVGCNSVIGANSVVTKNIENNSLYTGIPADKKGNISCV